MESPQSSAASIPELKCDHCSKTFGQRKNLNQHITRIHKAQRYECNVCHALLSSGFRLKNHLISVHKKKNKIKFVKSHLVTATNDGCETSPEAKKYIILEQAGQIRQMEIKIAKAKTAIENLRKKIANKSLEE